MASRGAAEIIEHAGLDRVGPVATRPRGDALGGLRHGRFVLVVGQVYQGQDQMGVARGVAELQRPGGEFRGTGHRRRIHHDAPETGLGPVCQRGAGITQRGFGLELHDFLEQVLRLANVLPAMAVVKCVPAAVGRIQCRGVGQRPAHEARVLALHQFNVHRGYDFLGDLVLDRKTGRAVRGRIDPPTDSGRSPSRSARR